MSLEIVAVKNSVPQEGKRGLNEFNRFAIGIKIIKKQLLQVLDSEQQEKLSSRAFPASLRASNPKAGPSSVEAMDGLLCNF